MFFRSRKFTDEEFIEYIRKQSTQLRRIGRIFVVLFAVCFVGVLYLAGRLWQSFHYTFDATGRFDPDYGAGLVLGFLMGAMLFMTLWQFLWFLSMARGNGWFRIQMLLIKYHDLATQKT